MPTTDRQILPTPSQEEHPVARLDFLKRKVMRQ